MEWYFTREDLDEQSINIDSWYPRSYSHTWNISSPNA